MTDILQIASKGDAKTLLQDMRVRAIFSPYYLVKAVLGYKDLVPHLHQHDSDLFLDRWAAGHRKQWIEWPRGFFKSTMFTIGTGIWIVLPVTDEDSQYAVERLEIDEDVWYNRVKLHDQDATQLLAFETITNSKKKINEIKWHFEENQLFRSLFPEIAYQGTESPWRDDCLKIRRKGYGKRLQEGSFEAIGVDGALQSRHYRIVWEDDLVGKKAVESEVTMESTIRWHGLLHGAFENAAEQIRFGVSNRWGYNDLNSYVRKNEPDFYFYTRRALEPAEDTGELESIFPERYPTEAILKIRDTGSMTRYDFSCQYQNSPVMPGEQEATTEKLHYYEIGSDNVIKCSCGANWHPRQLLRYLHYDPYNAKGVNSKSCPAISILGAAPDDHRFLLDYWLHKGSYGHVYSKLYDFNDRWHPHSLIYEDVGHQNMTEFHLREMEKNPDHLKKHRRMPRIIAESPHSKAKEVRIRDHLIPVITQGKFACRKKHTTFLTMLETFPNEVLDHDYDLLDELAYGAKHWKSPLTSEEEQKITEGDDEYLKQLGAPYSQMEQVA